MKFFKSYKKEYDLACQVMGAMAEEIKTLREQNEGLRKDNRNLREQVLTHRKREDWLEGMNNRQGATLKALRDVIITTEEITANK